LELAPSGRLLKPVKGMRRGDKVYTSAPKAGRFGGAHKLLKGDSRLRLHAEAGVWLLVVSLRYSRGEDLRLDDVKVRASRPERNFPACSAKPSTKVNRRLGMRSDTQDFDGSLTSFL